MVLNIAVFSSDGGFNVKDFFAYQERYCVGGVCPFRIVYCFSDSLNYKASSNYLRSQKYLLKLDPAGARFNIQCEAARRGIHYDVLDINDFYRSFGYRSKTDRQLPQTEKLRIRHLYNSKVEDLLVTFEKRTNIQIDLILLETYLSILTKPLLNRTILNIHWGDLSRCDSRGKRIYTGFHGILNSVLNVDKAVYSTVHVVNEEVDGGRILKRSRPIAVDFERDFRLLEFDFPTSPKAAIRFFQNPLNYEKALELEALYEAYLRCYRDSELLLECLEERFVNRYEVEVY